MPGVARAALPLDPGLPPAWEEVGRVSSLALYPVKSLAGLKVTSMTTGIFAGEAEGGLVDRQMMVLDSKGKMVTARKYPHMTLVQPSLLEGGEWLELNYPGLEGVKVKLPSSSASPDTSMEVFGDMARGVDLGLEVGQWLSEAILQDRDGGLRVVFHIKGGSSRPDKVEDAVLWPTLKPSDKPYYADGFPYMLLTKPSISGLNSLLEEEGVDLVVEEVRFRPNIVVEGEFEPFAEDKWAYIKIGDTTVFRHSTVCARCVFTTVDPFMGDKHPREEPLKTLRKWRCATEKGEKKEYGSSPFFGVNLGVEVIGEVKVGDVVSVGKYT